MNNADAALILAAADRAILKVSLSNPGRVTKADQDDLRNETFVKVAESFDASRGDLKGYAYRVAYNESIDFLRNRGGKRRNDQRIMSTDATVGDESDLTLGDILVNHTPNPLQALISKRRAEAASVLLADMSDALVSALDASCDDDSMSGAQRVAKKRAIDTMQEALIA